MSSIVPMVIKQSEAATHAWLGVEFRELIPLEPGAAIARAEDRIGALLTSIHGPQESFALDLRFRRDPEERGLRCAVLCRVNAPSERAAQTNATDLVEFISSIGLASCEPLTPDDLGVWLRGRAAPQWALTIKRRMYEETPPFHRATAIQCLDATDAAWNSFLVELMYEQRPIDFGVRVRRVSLPGPVLSDLDDHLNWLLKAAVDRVDPDSISLGSPYEIPGSPFASDGARALRQCLDRRNLPRFALAMYAHGTGQQPASPLRFASVVPSSVDRPASLEFGAAPLVATEVALKDLNGYESAQRSLKMQIAGQVDTLADGSALSVFAATVDLLEAQSLLHVPRFGDPPTPGFDIHGFGEPRIVPDEPFVFVSYSRNANDVAAVYQLFTLLRGSSIPFWADHRLIASDPLGETIGSVLSDRHCAALVVALTEGCHYSKWVREEFRTARNLGLPIIQAQLRETPLLDVGVLAVRLVGWNGNLEDVRAQGLCSDIASMFDRQRPT